MQSKKSIQFSLLITTLLMATNYAVARDVVIEGASIEQEVSCNNNNLIIRGASNVIQASGHCNTIEVNGADVKVTANSVSNIKIIGADSSVIYKTSPNKNGKALVSINGASSYAKKL